VILAEARKLKEFIIVWSWKGRVYGRTKLEGSQPNLFSNADDAKTLVEQLSAEDKAAIREANKEWEAKKKTKPPAKQHSQNNSMDGATGYSTQGPHNRRQNNNNGRNRAQTFNRSPYRTRSGA